MPLSVGDKLGPYEILGPIGAGGMGEVYRARDPRLNRDVAIKVSAAQFSERFEREARAAFLQPSSAWIEPPAVSAVPDLEVAAPRVVRIKVLIVTGDLDAGSQ